MGKPYQGLSEQELRLAVTGHLLDAATAGSFPTVLLLDEAQHLSQPVFEELRLLGNLETRRGTALFAVLVAQPALRECFRQPDYEPFAQRVAVRATIEPLTASESVDYLRHQLRAAGGDSEKVFNDEALSLLAGGCGGVPRLLNRAAVLALELAADAEAERVDVEAALEALDRLGLTPAESAEPPDPVLLPHPARTAEPARSKRGKSTEIPATDEAGSGRGSKDRASRKRTA
jgi:hypothetical protein